MNLLLWLGVIGTALFVLIFTLDGATRPGYSMIRHPVSALSLGERGWVQKANFVVCGLLIAGSAVGIVQAVENTAVAILVGVFGLAVAASGVLSMDPQRGYPPGTPEGPAPTRSRENVWHDRVALVAFPSLGAAALVAGFALEDSAWGVFSWVTSGAVMVLFFAFGAAWEANSRWVGLIQRPMIVVGWTWLALLCLHLMR